ncbi:MAG: heavy metal-associated domain-containing protein [bacterium]
MHHKTDSDSTISLKIEGMHCGMCVSRIEKALKELDGVSEATVSLEENRADVRYDSGSVKTGELIAAVEEAGYSASV